MKKCLLWMILLVVVSICSPAAADAYIHRTPTSEQLQEAEAVQRAMAFVHDLTGVEPTGLFRIVDGMKVKGQTDAHFGPGDQWFADTQDDCWAITLRNETRINTPFVVLHGTTGEVVYWEYSDSESQILYINMQPQEIHIPLEDAMRRAQRHIAEVFSSADPVTINPSAAFGPANNWNDAAHSFDASPAWHLQWQCGASKFGSILVNAYDGAIWGLWSYSMEDVFR